MHLTTQCCIEALPVRSKAIIYFPEYRGYDPILHIRPQFPTQVSAS